MALPVTITGGVFALDNGQRCGPIKVGSNYYLALRDSTNVGQINIWKATDPTDSWTEQDSFIVEASTDPVGGIAMIPLASGNIIVLGTNSATGERNTEVGLYSTSTDTFTSSPVVDAATSLADGGLIDIVQAASGDLYAFYPQRQFSMGTVYYSTYYAKSTNNGASWGTPVLVAPSGLGFHHPMGAVLDGDGLIHIIYHDGNHCAWRTLDTSDDSLGTAADASDTSTRTASGVTAPGVCPVAYTTGTTERVVVGWVKDSDVDIYTSEIDDAASSGTPAAEERASDSSHDVYISGNTPVAAMAVDGTKVHLLYVDTSARDIFHRSNDDGAGWVAENGGSAVISGTGAISDLSIGIYERGGSTVIGVLYNDGGTAKYNEIAVATPASLLSPPRWRRSPLLRM